MIKLLSTDFDGTLVDHGSARPVNPALFDHIVALREKGARWAVNTGRTLDHIVSGLDEFAFPIEPDFVLTCEREVFHRGANGWEDFGDWNGRCALAHETLFANSRTLLDEIGIFLRTGTTSEVIFENQAPIGIYASSESDMDRVLEFIDSRRAGFPDFHYQRNTMYLRFCHADYHKGAALGELARLTGVEPSEIFAAGDHYNDIPMLDGRFAKMTACPANAVEPVKKTVRDSGGRVATKACSDGVVEALQFFEREL
ncbi:MAG: HAD hydrolase family protein [Verrucomicrobiota bacterium]|nr:HAD hydrolase family protein [Verrucomicrobiota bacterium]